MSVRKSCPKCQSNKTKKVEDRSKPMYQFGGVGASIYKKLWLCGDCGEKWE